jgi:Putative peptidoglycan binding domain
MSECGMCECYKCSQRVRKAGAHRDTIEIQSGRSSGGVGIGLRGLRFYSGRTYYRKKEIWLCHDCYLARSRPWWSRRPAPAPAPAPGPAAPAGESKYLAALEREMGSEDRQTGIGIIAVFIGGAVILSIVMLPVFFRGNSTDAAKPQAADRTAVVAPLQDANNLKPPPSVIMTAQNRLIELGFLAGPADGVWGTKSRAALRAFKIANGLASDDKWDALVSGRLYSTQAVRSPLPLATTR